MVSSLTFNSFSGTILLPIVVLVKYQSLTAEIWVLHYKGKISKHLSLMFGHCVEENCILEAVSMDFAFLVKMSSFCFDENLT